MRAHGHRLGQLFLVAIAFCLGSFLANLYLLLEHTEGLHQLRRDGGAVEWRLYDIGHEDVEESWQRARAVSPRPGRLGAPQALEKAARHHPMVSRAFLAELLSHPLACSPGREGLLQAKYGGLLQALERYAAFHKRAKGEEDGRKLVWLCDVYHYCGGMADRLKGIAYALLLAMFSNRVLQISWGDSVSGESAYLQPNVIDWILPVEVYEELYIEEVFMYVDGVSPEVIADEVLQYHNPIYLYFIHLGSVLDNGLGVDVSYEQLKESLRLIESEVPVMLALGTNMEPSSLLSRNKTADQPWIASGMEDAGLADLSPEDIDGIVGIIFRYLFRFSEDLMAEVAVAQQVLGLGSLTYTGVHVRTGFAGTTSQESVDHPKLIRYPWQWDRVLQCAAITADEHVDENSLIFLATDSPLVKHMALSAHGSRLRTLDNSVLHLDRLGKIPHDQFANETEGTLSVFVELILLAQAHVQVCSPGSGYTLVSTQLCSLPPTRVIDGLQCN